MLLALAFLSHGPSASAKDPVAAEELFIAGRTAMDGGDLLTACKRFEESERLDPAAGTLMNWGECLSRRGMLAASWLKWREAVEALPPGDERRTAAEERLHALEPRVPRLEIALGADVPPGAVVEKDGAAVDPATFGLSLPVDPGPHRIAVRAPGRATHETTETLAEGERRVLVVNAGAPVLPAPAALALPALPREAPRAPEPSHGPPIAGYVIGGIGAASLVTGVTFGILAITEKGRMNNDCSKDAGSLLCGGAGLSAAHTGQTYATVANVAVPIGLVGLGVGGYLIWSNARTSDRTVLRASPLGSHGGQIEYARTF